MKLRHLAAWISGVALVGTGATLLCAQSPQPPREGPVRIGRDKLRAEVIKLRTEVEMLRFDYELARDGLLEELKIERGLKMAGGMIAFGTSIQAAINQEAGAEPPRVAPRRETEQDRKKAAEAAKAAEREEKKAEAQEAAIIAERKKELARLFALLAEKRLDLEDAERNYRENPR
jgi:hypothetical protein